MYNKISLPHEAFWENLFWISENW